MRLRRWLRPRTRWLRLRELRAQVGWRAALSDLLCGRFDLWGRSEYKLYSPLVMFPIWVRSKSSDLDVVSQVFLEEEYGCLDSMKDVGLVIDCGANVGYSTAYFLSRFAGCQVVAIEPDAGNYAMLRRNMAPYGSRVTMIHGGVWSRAARLSMAADHYRDGREWSRQVRVCEPEEDHDVEGVGIADLLKESGYDRISILKVDVEGAEAVIFADNYESWIEKIDVIAIELHDDSVFGTASDVFAAAIAGRDFQVSRSGELTICKKRAV
jgi:FkbM family methyltransferase